MGECKSCQMSPEAWRNMHEKTGCPGCKYTDSDSLFKGPCCTYPMKLEIDKDGRCLVREEKDEA